MNSYTFGYSSYAPYVHSWPGKVKDKRSKGCGKHRKAKR